MNKIENLISAFNTERGITIPVNGKKLPLTKWTTEDKKLNTAINMNYYLNNPNSEMERLSLGFDTKIDYSFIVIDIDRTDDGTLALVRSMLTDEAYNGKIIAYPSRKGAHFWFSIPSEVEDGGWWRKRHTGYVTKTGIGPIDYLPNGIINVALRSGKTGQIELMQDWNNFAEGDLNADMVALFNETGFESLELNWDNIELLPELPVIAWPLKKPSKDQTIDDILFQTGAGRNTEAFTSWAGQLNMASELQDDTQYDMEECLYWMNDNLTGDAWFEDLDQVIESVSSYDNLHCTEPYKLSGKAAKVRKERVKKEREISKNTEIFKEEDKALEYSEIIYLQKAKIAEFLIENWNLKLIGKDTVVLRLNDIDYVDSELISGIIMNSKQDSNVDMNWGKSVLAAVKTKLAIMINEGKYQYATKYTEKPLWVDKNGKYLNPFDLVDENGNLKIMDRVEAGVENDVIPFRLTIDFNNIKKYNEKAYSLIGNWIMNAVNNDKEKFLFVWKYFGYTFMVGAKFTRQIGFIRGVTNSGKSTFEEIMQSLAIPGSVAQAGPDLFDGKFGLEPLAGKTRGILDEAASAFNGKNGQKGNPENIKRVSGAMTVAVEPKGAAKFQAFVPKITTMANELPEGLDYSDPAIMNRLAFIDYEQALDFNVYNNQTKEFLINNSIEAIFMFFINTFKNATYADLGSADKCDFWKSPFNANLIDFIEENNKTEFIELERVIKNGTVLIEGRNSKQIKEDILNLNNSVFYELHKFVLEKQANVANGLKSLGYDLKSKRIDGSVKKVWTQNTGD